MNDKLLAGLVTGIAITPICALCVLGPAAVGSLLAGAVSWAGGIGPLANIALMGAAGLLAYHLFLRRRAQTNRHREDTPSPAFLADQEADRGTSVLQGRRNSIEG